MVLASAGFAASKVGVRKHRKEEVRKKLNYADLTWQWISGIVKKNCQALRFGIGGMVFLRTF